MKRSSRDLRRHPLAGRQQLAVFPSARPSPTTRRCSRTRCARHPLGESRGGALLRPPVRDPRPAGGKVEFETVEDGKDRRSSTAGSGRHVSSFNRTWRRGAERVVEAFKTGRSVETGEAMPAANYTRLLRDMDALAGWLAATRDVRSEVQASGGVRAGGAAPQQAPEQGSSEVSRSTRLAAGTRRRDERRHLMR